MGHLGSVQVHSARPWRYDFAALNGRIVATNLKAIVGKLNPTARAALEGAAGLCLSRTHYDIEVEHFLLKALDTQDGDVARILRHFEIDASRLTGDLMRALD